jgi:hypothetical protein
MDVPDPERSKMSDDLEVADEQFLVTLDNMIESTCEFIADDQISDDNDPEGRLADLKALEHVRALFEEAFRVDSRTRP